MLERRPAQGHKIFSMPQPEPGMLKTREDLLPDFRLQSGRVSVDTFLYEEDIPVTYVRIEPEIGDGTLSVINESIARRPDLANARTHAVLISHAMPSAHMVLDGGIKFWFEGQIVADITQREGFAIRSELFEHDPEIASVRLIEPETDEDMYTFRFARRQTPMGTDEDRTDKDHLLAVSFQFKKDDFKSLNNLVKEVLANPSGNPEKLRSIINVSLHVESVDQLDNDDQGGEGVRFSSSPDDKGDSGGGILV